MSKKAAASLLIVLNLLQGVTIYFLLQRRPPTVAVIPPPWFDLPAALGAAGRRVGVHSQAEWHDVTGLLWSVLERYEKAEGSGSPDDVAGFSGTQLRDEIRGNQQRALALENEIVALAARVEASCPQLRASQENAWQRLRERLDR